MRFGRSLSLHIRERIIVSSCRLVNIKSVGGESKWKLM